MDVPSPVFKSFDDLIIEFDIPYRDRRRYNTLMKTIVDSEIIDDVNTADFKGSFNLFEGLKKIDLTPKSASLCLFNYFRSNSL